MPNSNVIYIIRLNVEDVNPNFGLQWYLYQVCLPDYVMHYTVLVYKLPFLVSVFMLCKRFYK